MPQTEFDALTALLEFIKRQRGVDFTAYKEASLQRRLEHRMQAIESRSYSDYLDHIQATPEELNALLDTLFINVTRFFRDLPAWEVLAERVLPALLEANPSGPIRVWCAGVATGEEAYTTATLLAAALGDEAFKRRVKIFATDADDHALSHARSGDYSTKQIEDVPDQYRSYFEQVDDRHVFRVDLRRSVIFGRHNLLEDAPISRLDLLICRNTMMYFNRDAQQRILSRFYFALKDDAALFLGKAETLLTRRQLFAPLDPKLRIFKKLRGFGLARPVPAPLDTRDGATAGKQAVRANYMQHSALNLSPVAQILVDHEGNLVFANEVAQHTFGVEQGLVGRPFSEAEISYRPIDLRTMIDRVRTDGHVVTAAAVERAGPAGRVFYDVTVAPVQDGNAKGGFSIAFTDVTNAHDLRTMLETSKGELETAYEELQSTNEELETTNEELQSTVEELETTNEELQSTNEELQTMNEELQSTNDEIRIVNDQLGDTTDQVTRLNAYLQSIIDGQQAAVIVTDAELNVSMWNRKAHDLWGMNASEVLRQAFMNLDIGLPVHELRDGMRRVLRDETPTQEIALPAHDRKGKAFQCQVSITPLRDPSGNTVGVILAMEPAPER